MKTLLSTAAVVALLAAAPAFAAENPVPADQQAPAATDQMKTDDMMKKKPRRPRPPRRPIRPRRQKPPRQPTTTSRRKLRRLRRRPTRPSRLRPPRLRRRPTRTSRQRPLRLRRRPIEAKPADTAAAAAPADQPKFITQQTDQEKLASKWIGQTIYNQADENVGDVNDLVIGQNGQIDAVVIGVGGFLGIGEKNVAVPFTAIQAATDATAT